MDDLVEAIKTRISSPLLGYFALAFAALNWKPFFYLVVSSGDVLERLKYVDTNTDFYTLLLWPLIFSLIFAVFYPWALYFLGRLTAWPMELRATLQARSEHNLIMVRRNLEESRARLLETAEVALMKRAQRDQKLEEIPDEEVKNKLRTEFDKLRAEYGHITTSMLPEVNLARHKELMDIAQIYRTRAKEATNSFDVDQLLEKARELEAQAHELILNRPVL